MAAAGGARTRTVALHLSGAEAVALDAARSLDGADGAPLALAVWVRRATVERLRRHAEGADVAKKTTAAQALACLDLEMRLIGAAGPANKPAAVRCSPRALLVGSLALAERIGDHEAAAIARAALGEPCDNAPGRAEAARVP